MLFIFMMQINLARLFQKVKVVLKDVKFRLKQLKFNHLVIRVIKFDKSLNLFFLRCTVKIKDDA